MEIYRLAHSGKDLDDAIAGRFTTEELTVKENGIYTPGEGVDGFSKVDVRVPATEYGDVCFWDYDGTLVYTCTLEEAHAMTELPQPPDHSQDAVPLTFVEWNWTLKELNDLTRKADVGAMYEPTDGKTHMTFRLTPKTGLTVTFVWYNHNADATFTFDWGDGTVEDAAGANKTHTHTYADYGTYHCTVDTHGNGWNPNGFSETTIAKALVGDLIFSANSGWIWPGAQGNKSFANANIERCVLPPGAASPTGSGLLAACQHLKHLNIPRGFTSLGITSANKSMRRISLPRGLTALGVSALSGMAMEEVRLPEGCIGNGRFTFDVSYVLKHVDIPEGRTAITYQEFSKCYALKELVIPSTVTQIDGDAFISAGIIDYWLRPVEPPTLSATSAFSGILTGTIIWVPAESLDKYKTATNWSTYADYMMPYEGTPWLTGG